MKKILLKSVSFIFILLFSMTITNAVLSNNGTLYNSNSFNVNVNSTVNANIYQYLFTGNLSSNPTRNDGTISGYSFIDGTKTDVNSIGSSVNSSYGRAVRFDGTDSYITLDSDITIQSVCLWIELDTYSAFGRTMLSKLSAVDQAFYVHNLQGYSIVDDSGNFIPFSTNTFPSLNTWEHLCLTQNGSQWNLYLNGSLADTENKLDDLSINSISSRAVHFEGEFDGDMDEIRFYDHELSSSEVLQDYNTAILNYPTLHRYSFEELGGPNVYDNNHLILREDDYFMRFDGINDDVNIPNNPRIDLIDNITVSFDLNFHEKKSSHRVIRRSKDNDWQFSADSAGNLKFRLENAASGATTMNSGVLNLNQWYHITGTYNSSGGSLYVDGVLVDSDPYIGTLKDNGASIKIGEGDNANRYLNGSLDDIRLYNKSLSSTEVSALYAGTFEDTSNLVFDYDFQDLMNNNIKDRNSMLCTGCTSYDNSISVILDGIYTTWYSDLLNTVESQHLFIADTTGPVIDLTFPTEINLNNQTINFSNYINLTDLSPVDSCTVSVTEFGQPQQNFSDCFNTTFVFSNLGNAVIEVTANDTLGNSNSNTDNININLFRIQLNFFGLFTGNPITNVSVNESTLGFLGNSGNDTFLLVYLNPDNYSFTATKTFYEDTNVNFTKSNTTALESVSFNMPSNFNFVLKDERTLEPWNLSATSSTILQVICADDTVIQHIVNSTNFSITIPCVGNRIKFLIDYTTDSYFRSILLEEPTEFKNIYLIDLTTTQSVFNTFTTFDLTGAFENPRLSFRKNVPVDGEVEITGDIIDVESSVPAYFILNDEYILHLTSDNQPTRVIGFYSADSPGDKVLKLFSLDFGVSSTNLVDKVHMNSYINNTVLFGTFNDTTNTASLATFTVYNTTQYGNILFTTSVADTNVGSFSYNIPTAYENVTLYTVISVINDIDTFEDSRTHRQNNTLDLGLINFNIDLDWVVTIFLGFLGLVLTIRTASVGALIIMAVGGLFATFGWFSLSWTVIAIGLLLAIIKIAKESEADK